MVAELEGVASLTHNHGWRFGQGDLYVLVRMRATVITRRAAHSTGRSHIAMPTRSFYTMAPRSPTRLRSTRPSSPTRGGCRPPTSRRASCRTASRSPTRRAEITPRCARDRREMRPRRGRRAFAPTCPTGVAAAVADDSERSPRDCDGVFRGVPPAGPSSGDAVHGWWRQ